MSEDQALKRLSGLESAIQGINGALEQLGQKVERGFSLNPFTTNNPLAQRAATIGTQHLKNLSVTNAKINDLNASKITAGLITTTRLNLALIIVEGASWTDNSPGAGSVAWSANTVYHQGVAYSITGSNTALKYIWWSSTTTNTVFQSSNTRPVLTDVEFMIATNDTGSHDVVWNAVGNLVINPTHLNFEALASLFVYGDGIDGTVTISADTHLTRDMMYDTLTVDSGKVLFPDGYRIFVKNTLTNNGTIRCNGNNAAGTTRGAALAAGNMGGSSAGGFGQGPGPVDGLPGDPLTNALGGVGGAGGNAPARTGGAGGTISTTVASRHGLVLLSTSAEIRGGTGGGGGAALNAGSNNSGAGGSGGGVIIIAARSISNGSGTIEAKGGNGSAAVGGGNGSGGGAGGAGGAIVLVYRTIVQGTVTVTGGTGGAGSIGLGVDFPGATGGTGLSLLIQQEA